MSTLWKEINEIASSRTDLRKFGLTLGIFFGLLGAYFSWRRGASAPYFLGAGSFFLAFAFVRPQVLKPIQKVWMTLALLMGWVMSRVILCAVFFLAVTPIGLLVRLSGKDLLDINPGVRRGSYWLAHKTRMKEDYENQF